MSVCNRSFTPFVSTVHPITGAAFRMSSELRPCKAYGSASWPAGAELVRLRYPLLLFKLVSWWLMHVGLTGDG